MEGDRTPQALLQTKSNERWPMFSSDGRWIAYACDESGQYEIYVRPFRMPGGKRQVSTGGGTAPVWNPNGQELFYRNGDDLMVVGVEMNGELTLGKPKLLFKRHSAYGEYDVTADGQRFVMIDESEPVSGPTQLVLVQNWVDELKRLVPTENCPDQR